MVQRSGRQSVVCGAIPGWLTNDEPHTTRRFVNQRLICVFAVATATLGALPAARAQAPTAAALRVRAEQHDRSLSAAEVAALPHQHVRVVAEGSSDSVAVAGVSLWSILQSAGVPSPEASGRQRAATWVRAIGADGQTAIFALVELDPGFSRKTVLVVDQRNGHPLDASEGPWRIIVPDEARHARWIRGLVAIEVGTLAPFDSARRPPEGR